MREEQELTNPDSRIWDMFSNAWKAWIVSHSQLNEILLQFDNRDDFDENQQCIVLANSELDRHCFEVLLAASHSDRIDQETIRRFYDYGYFNQCKQIENLINVANARELIERRQQIEQLPDQVNRLRQEINDLRTQFSGLESINELQHVLEQRIAEVERSFEEQISELTLAQSFSQLTQSVESLNSRLDMLENSQTEIESGINDFVEHIERIIRELEQQIQDTDQSVTEQFDQLNSVVRGIIAQNEQQRHSIEQSVTERFSSLVSNIAEIRSDVEAQKQPIDTSENDSHTLQTEKSEGTTPRTAHKAVEFGEYYAAKLGENRERYQNENEYLADFQDALGRYGITESNETAPAFHVALKAFPVLEIADTRIFKIWNVTCNKHFFYTKLFVEMGWLGIQDWFPRLLADECFGERLKRIDFQASIQKMLEMGNMLWAIHFRNCDRSFPECYLPSFIQWIKNIPEFTIKVFLTRTTGNNRCEITEDAYALVARLPEPQEEEPIEAQNLRTSGIILTQSEWNAWCQPPPNVDQHLQDKINIVNQLRATINENGGRIPKTPLQEILHYLRLSQTIEMAPTRALDWALTMRLLPCFEKQPELIDHVLKMLDQEHDDLEHFQEGLQQARENR
ncbi:hypothetical protein F4225_02530 [Candidatus Poribacteria bacterium]|nr:hypothetical protein [Candidatus Poribacteria bacterium]